MENRYLKISLLIYTMAFILGACEEIDLRSAFVSYESANQRFNQSLEWNNDHPFREITVPVNDYSIFVMGDSHLGTARNFDTFLSEAMKVNASAAVMVGDLTTGHAEDYRTFQDHLPNQDSIATFKMVGNHDLYFNGWKQFYALFGSTTYPFAVRTPEASDLYICLDSGSGTLGGKQLNWLKTILEKERPYYRRCVVFTHLNLFRIRHTGSTNPLVEELHVLMELSVKHQIDMIVTGHDHEKNVVVLGNTTHITLDALSDDYKDAGYLELNILNGSIEHTFVNF
jgi:predicted phosphodiesterase